MSLVEIVRDAGIVGCGGAGFPTHIKYNTKADVFIINGVECEPLLESDKYLLRTYAPLIAKTADVIREALGAPRCIIAVKKTYLEEIKAVNAAIGEYAGKLELALLDSYYPAGDEHAVVCEVTGKQVPPGGLPLDVGAVVSNVATVYAVSLALEGKPLTDRILTVTGEVAHPVILRVPVGTTFEDCIRQAGGVRCGAFNVICGGPMMGCFIKGADVPQETVRKTTSGIIVVKDDGELSHRQEESMGSIRLKAASACTQCSYCTSLCPRYLLGSPIEMHKIMRAYAHCTDMEKLLDCKEIRNAAYCCECALCTVFSCPMGLQPSKVSAMFRRELAKNRIRAEKITPVQRFGEREYRKVPTGRILQRLGLSQYLEKRPETCTSYEPDVVRISLSQGAGVPSLPAVEIGTGVQRGDKIACCPEGALGSDVHASITGTVTEINDFITIAK